MTGVSPGLQSACLHTGRLRQDNAATRRSKYVFCAKNGGKLRTKLREKLIKIGQQAGIEDLTRLYTLRYTFASRLVMQGVDLPTVMKTKEHADVQTTMTYAPLAPDHLV